MDNPPQPGVPVTPLSPSDERTWAMLAHLSMLLNLVTGFLGTVAAFLIFLVYKDRSRYVAYQAMQAFLFQLIWWGGAGLLAGLMEFITFLLVITVVGICLTPITGLLAIIFGLMPIASLNPAVKYRLRHVDGH